MGLKGAGAVAIWHDIEAAALDDYYAWHSIEHLPERLSIPGFLRGRRYGPIEGDLDLFTLYETKTPESAYGPAYQARLNDPSDWSRRVMPHFRGMTRAVCRIERSTGEIAGGVIATWRYEVADPDAHRSGMAILLEQAAKQPGVAGVHLLSADLAASGLATTEQKARGAANQAPPWTLLVEGWIDADPLRALRGDLLSDAALRAAGVDSAAAFGLYQLQATLESQK